MEKINDKIFEPVSRYTLPNSMLNEILDKLKETLIKNSSQILDANKEDVKHNKKQIKTKAKKYNKNFFISSSPPLF